MLKLSFATLHGFVRHILDYSGVFPAHVPRVKVVLLLNSHPCTIRHKKTSTVHQVFNDTFGRHGLCPTSQRLYMSAIDEYEFTTTIITSHASSENTNSNTNTNGNTQATLDINVVD